jgi:hypothetical protein
MSWSLGSIFVELTCNTGKFLTGMEKGSQAARKTGRDIRGAFAGIGESLAALGPGAERVGSLLEGVGNKAAGAFDVAASKGRGLGIALSGSLLGGVTALAGGMFALAEHSAEVGSKIFESSEKTGIAAGQMSGLMAVTKQVNGNFESLTTSLARAGANLEKTAEGGGKTNQVLFQMMGGARGAAELGLKPMGDRLQEVLAHIFALHDAGQRNLALNQLLGRGWMENVETLKVLAEQGYAPAIAKAKEFGIYFNPEQAKQAKEFQIAMAQLKGELSAFAIVVGKEVIPTIIGMTQGLQGLGAFIDRMKSVKSILISASGPLGPLIAAYIDAKDAAKDSEKAQTDFLVSLDQMTAGAGKATDGEAKLTGATKAHVDALAELIGREKDEIAALDIHDSKARAIQLAYDRTLEEIDKYVKAGGSVVEATQAQALALDILKKKYEEIANLIPKLPKWGQDFAAAGGAPEIDFTKKMMPGVPGFGNLAQGPALDLTAQQEAALGTETDKLRGYFKALAQETELSDRAFKQLADTFPGLTKELIAANPEGQKLIAWLAKLDKIGGNLTFGETLAKNLEEIKIAGDQVGSELANAFTRSVDQIEDQFARMVVTGKANFKQVAQQLEESLIKAGEQKAVSSLLGKFGVGGSLSKPDGTQGNPLFVKLADKLGAMFGGGSGSGASGGGGDNDSDSGGGGMSGLESSLGSGFRGIMGGIRHALGSLASTFGGFLAGGGDVDPGKAYVVGERHPELFVPHASGAVVPSLSTQQLRPLYFSPVYHISTPDANSFRRSQSQLITEGVRAATLAHSRNS